MKEHCVCNICAMHREMCILNIISCYPGQDSSLGKANQYSTVAEAERQSKKIEMSFLSRTLYNSVKGLSHLSSSYKKSIKHYCKLCSILSTHKTSHFHIFFSMSSAAPLLIFAVVGIVLRQYYMTHYSVFCLWLPKLLALYMSFISSYPTSPVSLPSPLATVNIAFSKFPVTFLPTLAAVNIVRSNFPVFSPLAPVNVVRNKFLMQSHL